jgi:hypothetical protein
VLVVMDEDAPRAASIARRAHLVVSQHRYPGVDESSHYKLNELDQALRAVA